jgi:hypothetical protein
MNTNITNVIANLKKVFTRRMVDIDTETGELYLQEDVNYEDAEQMLILIGNLHAIVGFKEEEKAEYLMMKNKFYQDVDKDVELFRHVLMTNA